MTIKLMQKKINFLYLFGIFYLFNAAIPVYAQNREHRHDDDMSNNIRRRAVVLDIDARVLDEQQAVSWSQNNRRIAIPGSPVGIQLAGSNIVVAVQFTPFIRRSGNVLVTQSQIWIGNQERGINYYTSIQTIPMEFGEPIHFFPLGQSQHVNSSIEIIITVSPGERGQNTEEITAGTGNGR